MKFTKGHPMILLDSYLIIKLVIYHMSLIRILTLYILY